jgi:hypothetical protein
MFLRKDGRKVFVSFQISHQKSILFKIALFTPPRSFNVFFVKENFGTGDIDARNAARKVIIYK